MLSSWHSFPSTPKRCRMKQQKGLNHIPKKCHPCVFSKLIAASFQSPLQHDSFLSNSYPANQSAIDPQVFAPFQRLNYCFHPKPRQVHHEESSWSHHRFPATWLYNQNSVSFLQQFGLILFSARHLIAVQKPNNDLKDKEL